MHEALFVFDFCIAALSTVIFIVSIVTAIAYGHLSFTQYCVLTYTSLMIGMFAKNWIAAINWMSLGFLISVLVYFETYVFICTFIILTLITIYMAVIGKRAIDSDDRGGSVMTLNETVMYSRYYHVDYRRKP